MPEPRAAYGDGWRPLCWQRRSPCFGSSSSGISRTNGRRTSNTVTAGSCRSSPRSSSGCGGKTGRGKVEIRNSKFEIQKTRFLDPHSEFRVRPPFSFSLSAFYFWRSSCQCGCSKWAIPTGALLAGYTRRSWWGSRFFSFNKPAAARGCATSRFQSRSFSSPCRGSRPSRRPSSRA